MAGVRDNTVTNVASGGIASFKSVGQVPLKSLKVGFNPIQEGDGDPSPSNVRPITGWTECNLNVNGKNLFSVEIIKGAVTAESGIITVYESGNRNRLVGYYVEIPAGTYTISCKENRQVNAYFYTEPSPEGYKYSERLTTWTTMPRTFTIAEKRFAVFVFRNSDNSYLEPSDITEVQLELGSTATTYEPYNGSTIPVSWSDLGTVYGGYVDLISGEVWAELTSKNLGDFDYVIADRGTHQYFVSSQIGLNDAIDIANTSIQPYILCDKYKTVAAAKIYSGESGNYTISHEDGAAKRVRIRDDSYTDVTSFKSAINETYVIYKLKTPQLIGTISPIEIKSLIGVNNIWSNADTVEVQYCALESLDIYKQRFKTNEPHLQSASGNVVSFQTDMVAPLKECKVYFQPVQASGTPSPNNAIPISGWDVLKIFNTKKNLFNLNATFQNPSNTAFSNTTKRIFAPYTICNGTSGTNYFQGGNSSYSINGETLTINTISGYGVGFAFKLPPNTTFTVKATFGIESGYVGIGISSYSADGTFTKIAEGVNKQYLPYTFTTRSDTDIILLTFKATNSATYNIDIPVTNIQLELGSTATAHEPYNGSTASITLPSTYYGGYVDLNTGEGIQTFGYTNDLGTYTYVEDNDDVAPGTFRLYLTSNNFRGIKYMGKLFCSKYKGVEKGYRGYLEYNDISVTNSQANPILRIRDENFIGKTPEEIKTLVSGVQLAYELYTPSTFTLTPTQLKTLKNQNNIWSNTNGITEVKYWTHGSIADKRKVVWNQLAVPVLSGNYEPYDTNYVSISFNENEATRTMIQDGTSYRTSLKTSQQISLVSNHKYYMKHDIYPSVNGYYQQVLNNAQITAKNCPANQWSTLKTIATVGTIVSNIIFWVYETGTVTQYIGDTCRFKNPILIDLTLMFGEDNEPSTLEQFETLCLRNGINLSLAQPYDEGTQMYWYF